MNECVTTIWSQNQRVNVRCMLRSSSLLSLQKRQSVHNNGVTIHIETKLRIFVRGAFPKKPQRWLKSLQPLQLLQLLPPAINIRPQTQRSQLLRTHPPIRILRTKNGTIRSRLIKHCPPVPLPSPRRARTRHALVHHPPCVNHAFQTGPAEVAPRTVEVARGGTVMLRFKASKSMTSHCADSCWSVNQILMHIVMMFGVHLRLHLVLSVKV